MDLELATNLGHRPFIEVSKRSDSEDQLELNKLATSVCCHVTRKIAVDTQVWTRFSKVSCLISLQPLSKV
jgi:hypothetical protein